MEKLMLDWYLISAKLTPEIPSSGRGFRLNQEILFLILKKKI
jgi:hypothetical protein